MAAIAAESSYDYAEWGVASALMPRKPLDEFRESLAALRRSKLAYPVLNGFVPSDIKITGPDADRPALETFVSTSMERAEEAGVRIIVFGSGGARRIPDGFDRDAAHRQIVDFCHMTALHARQHGVTVVVEPLNKSECNVLNSVTECADLVNEVSDPNIRLLVDAYHMLRDGDCWDSIVTHGALLAHAHIATIPNRFAPGAEDCDFSEFFSALVKAGYNGRISIEGKIPNPETELPAALELMKRQV